MRRKRIDIFGALTFNQREIRKIQVSIPFWVMLKVFQFAGRDMGRQDIWKAK